METLSKSEYAVIGALVLIGLALLLLISTPCRKATCRSVDYNPADQQW